MSDKTTYLPENIASFGNLHFQAKAIVEGFLLGIHASPFHGFSVEFSQHRPYISGDDVRHIDWTLYGKTDRYYIRQYREDTNLSATILLDNSKSMAFKDRGKTSKYDYASLIAASFIHLLIRQNDACGLAIFNEAIAVHCPPKAISSYEHELIKTIQNTSCSRSTHIGDSLHRISENMTKKGLAIVISDCLDNKEALLSGLKHLRFLGHDVLLIQVLDPGEWELEGKSKTEFHDMENGRKIKLDVRQIKDEYHRIMVEYVNELTARCGEMGVDHSLILTSDDCRSALYEFLKKRQRLA